MWRRRDSRKSRLAFLGALLAVIAISGLIALSGWHNMVAHADDAVHVTSIEHHHSPSRQTDPDTPIHLLAHTVGQWISTAGSYAAPAGVVVAGLGWVAFEARLRSGMDPAALLRPPQG